MSVTAEAHDCIAAIAYPTTEKYVIVTVACVVQQRYTSPAFPVSLNYANLRLLNYLGLRLIALAFLVLPQTYGISSNSKSAGQDSAVIFLEPSEAGN